MKNKWKLVALLVGIALTSSIVFAQSPAKPAKVVIAIKDMPLFPDLPSTFGFKSEPMGHVIQGHPYIVLEEKVIKALPDDQIWISIIPQLEDYQSGFHVGWALFRQGKEMMFKEQ